MMTESLLVAIVPATGWLACVTAALCIALLSRRPIHRKTARELLHRLLPGWAWR